jgi:hypothetical protein
MKNCGDCYYFEYLAKKGMGKHGKCYGYPSHSLQIVHDDEKSCPYYKDNNQYLLPFGPTPDISGS